MEEIRLGKRSRLRSLNVVVPIIGLVYSGLIILYFTVAFNALSSPSIFTIIIVLFMLLFLASAYGVWRKSRLGYIAAVAITAIFLLAFGAQAGQGLGNPADLQSFLLTITLLPSLFAALVYSIAGLREVWRKGGVPKPPQTISRSSIVALLVIGFVLGGSAVGLMAGPIESRLLSSVGTSADITIVLGAGSMSNGLFFSPATFTAKVGQTVTWVNRDSMGHTVTNTNSTVFFDSQNMAPGATFKFTFTKVGTYPYVCSYHAWMQGKIIVTP